MSHLFPKVRGSSRWLLSASVVLSVIVDAGCGARQSSLPTAPGGSKDPGRWPANDRSMCNWRNRLDVEVSESAGPGALKPNIRRVFMTMGEADSRHRVIVCREVDTNLDGIKDVVRHFNSKGEPLREEADTNFDGKIDVWVAFANGRLLTEDDDTNGDAKPDVWKVYTNGELARVKRDRNFDGKPDAWEIYNRGRLERIGLDETGDEHVDRWDRDEIVRLQAEAEEAKATSSSDAGAADAAAPAPAKERGKGR